MIEKIIGEGMSFALPLFVMAIGGIYSERSGITNLYLTGLFDTVQMMSISGHKDQRTFFDYIKLSSDEIADKIMEKLRQSENIGNEGLF